MRPLVFLPLFFVSLFLFTPLPEAKAAELELASLFTDHMVLQRQQPVPVWGWAASGSKVEVAFAGQRKQAVADENGRWRVTLDPLKGNAKPATLIARSGEATIERKDVVVGEVWICSGQSNMQMGRGAVAEFKNAPEDGLRTFEVKRSVAFDEQERATGR